VFLNEANSQVGHRLDTCAPMQGARVQFETFHRLTANADSVHGNSIPFSGCDGGREVNPFAALRAVRHLLVDLGAVFSGREVGCNINVLVAQEI
jgi:hypothetical protein